MAFKPVKTVKSIDIFEGLSSVFHSIEAPAARHEELDNKQDNKEEEDEYETPIIHRLDPNTNTRLNIDDTLFNGNYRGIKEFINNYDVECIIGRGVESRVYLVTEKAHPFQQYAAKATKYRNSVAKKEKILKENYLLNKFGGNELYVKEIYDNVGMKEMIFIQPKGMDLRSWWNIFGLKQCRSRREREAVLKKILYKILLNLQQLKNDGYIHHDIKPENILVIEKQNSLDLPGLADKYSFHLIDYGLSRQCGKGKSITLNGKQLYFGTMGYNAWELMATDIKRSYNHNIDVYGVAITICELILGYNPFYYYNNYEAEKNTFCYSHLIALCDDMQVFLGDTDDFDGLISNAMSPRELYRETLRLKCQHWQNHFSDNNDNNNSSLMSSIIINKLENENLISSQFITFIARMISDDNTIRLSVESAINDDIFDDILI